MPFKGIFHRLVSALPFPVSEVNGMKELVEVIAKALVDNIKPTSVPLKYFRYLFIAVFSM